eukprot:1144388-Pelagomonas_calceolata.AAC.6
MPHALAGTFLHACWCSPALSCCFCPLLQAGPDGIVHVLMTAQDLHMRRADTVVRDLPGATHLLDLYSCKRVDKRKVS